MKLSRMGYSIRDLIFNLFVSKVAHADLIGSSENTVTIIDGDVEYTIRITEKKMS